MRVVPLGPKARKGESIFGRMTIDATLTVGPGCEPLAAVKALIEVAEGARVVKWVEFPDSFVFRSTEFIWSVLGSCMSRRRWERWIGVVFWIAVPFAVIDYVRTLRMVKLQGDGKANDARRGENGGT